MCMLRNVFYIFICRFLSGLPLSPTRVEGLGSDSFYSPSPQEHTSKIRQIRSYLLAISVLSSTGTELFFRSSQSSANDRIPQIISNALMHSTLIQVVVDIMRLYWYTKVTNQLSRLRMAENPALLPDPAPGFHFLCSLSFTDFLYTMQYFGPVRDASRTPL
ncbi:hypothetical protein Desti_1227 [Desulfomonile tiedjei DSM 6799]|uniref:Uncharacterized protein n=1 Tax=Desulfomonile tiedjei (strain ATCC 49306 / DSM 6799 / DCB-1) TaxID=706587 RepID=I4C2Z9_DESTA|nr:hypothetical protein Desti_1227 [Desulfomonile tiedjei DSM 6799]